MTSSSNANSTIWTYGVYELAVQASGSAPSLAIGNIIYFKETLADTNLINLATVTRNVGGTPTTFHNIRWGYSLATVPSGNTWNILVKVGY